MGVIARRFSVRVSHGPQMPWFNADGSEVANDGTRASGRKFPVGWIFWAVADGTVIRVTFDIDVIIRGYFFKDWR